MSKYWLFENVNLFEIMCPHKFKEYSKNHVVKKYDKGQFVYLEGDLAKNFYLIKSGKIKIGYWNESEDELSVCVDTFTMQYSKVTLFRSEDVRSETSLHESRR